MDKESRSDAEEPADKQAELFDLHVMMFADSSSATAVALQEAFAIDRAVAEKMLSQVPIVVKRAADPQVAAALLDVLQGLGAQVVLLPSAGLPAEGERKASESAVVSAPVWGGLDLEPRAPVAAQPALAPAASWQGGSWPSRGSSGPSSLPAPRASVSPADRRPQSGAPAGMASRAEDFVSGSEADLSEPPDLPEIPPLFDERSDEREEPALELEHPVSATRRSPFAPRPAPGPPSLDANRMPRVAPPVHSDLGLGTVPPLPSVSMVRAAPAPVRPAASRGGAAPGRSAAAPEPARVDRAPQPAGANLPEPASVDRATTPVARSAGLDSYWSGRRSPSPDADKPSPAGARVAPRPVKEPEALDGGVDIGARAQAPKAVPSSNPVEARSRGLALLQLLAGVLVFALGVHFDNSVLYGNATLVSLGAHGLALYGVGAGFAGLWP